MEMQYTYFLGTHVELNLRRVAGKVLGFEPLIGTRKYIEKSLEKIERENKK